jgi:hypothetical protein
LPGFSRIRATIASIAITAAVLGCRGVTATSAADAISEATGVVQEVAPATETAALATVTTSGALVAAPGEKILWGKIWNCGCHDRDGADSVAAELDTEHLPSDFAARLALGQYDYFAISFDPAVVDEDQLEKAITTAGGKIVPGPPASTT